MRLIEGPDRAGSSYPGEAMPFTSNWMTALVMDDSGDAVSLQLKMLDFRICWAKREKANQRHEVTPPMPSNYRNPVD